MKITRKYHFYAGHRNKQAGEKCGRLHGHTYDVEVTFVWEKFEGDVAMLFSDIDQKAEPIFKFYDHYLMLYKEDPLVKILQEAGEPYRELPFETSAENMAQHFYETLKAILPVARVSLAETKSGAVIFEPQ